MHRHLTRSLAGIALLAAATLGLAGTAAAAPAAPAAAGSACGTITSSTITQGDSSAGHLHFTVQVTAAAGTTPCTLDGRPTQIKLVDQNVDEFPTTIDPVGTPAPVAFGPGHPVSFDVTSVNQPGGPTATYLIHRDDVSGMRGQGKFPRPVVVTGPLQVSPYVPAA